MMTSNTTRTRRTEEERIADLQKEIAKLKKRAVEKKVKRDPALRHVSGAVRSIDKALASSEDKATREALSEARATLTACLALNGAAPSRSSGAKARRVSVERPDPERVLAYIRKHPGSRSEEIGAQFGVDTATLRPVLHELRDEGKIVVEGKARATRYSVAAG